MIANTIKIIKTRVTYAVSKITPSSHDPLSKPVIIVGNITVGGTGKTPLVLHIAELLARHNISYGIVMRGYGGNLMHTNTLVNAQHKPHEIGDEACLLFAKLQCPIVVGKNRLQGALLLQKNYPIAVIISDDGLQHSRLPRNIEIVVIDGQRKFGNGLLLPFGPLRDLPSRLATVDLVVVQGNPWLEQQYAMQLQPMQLRRLADNHSFNVNYFAGQEVTAICGIGNPARFLQGLVDLQMLIINKYLFPDHHAYRLEDVVSINGPIITTAKDAIKLQYLNFNKNSVFVLEVNAAINNFFDTKLCGLIKEKG